MYVCMYLITPDPTQQQVTAPEEWEELAAALGLAQGRGQALRNTYRQALLPFEQWQRQQQRAKEQGQEEEPTAVTGTPRTPSVKREQMQQGATEPSTSTTTTEEEKAMAATATAAAASAPASLTKGTRARTGSKPLAAAPAESAAYAKLVEDRRAHVGGKMVLGKKFWRFFPPQGVWMLGTVTGVEKGTRIVVRYDPEEGGGAGGGKPKEGRGKGKGKGPSQPAATQPAPVQVRRFTEAMGKRDALVLLANGASKEGARAIQEGEEFCEGCLRTRVFGTMAECYECGALRHAPCMDPPLKHLPYGDWFCPDCADAPVGGGAGVGGRGKMGGGMGGGGGNKQRKMMAGTKGAAGAAAPGVEELFASFGFEDGGDYTLEGYKQVGGCAYVCVYLSVLKPGPRLANPPYVKRL